MERRDHRTRLTKLLLRRAFTDLLRRKPIQSITVKEVCGLAGINRGTFYAHYADMYDLLHQLEEEMLADFQKALVPLLASAGPEATPAEFTAEIFQCLKDNSDLCTVTLGPFGDKEFAARLVNMGREKCLESYTRLFQQATPRQLEYYYAFVSAGCIGLLEKWLSDGMTASAQEIAQAAEGIMTSGIHFLEGASG